MVMFRETWASALTFQAGRAGSVGSGMNNGDSMALCIKADVVEVLATVCNSILLTSG